MLSYSFSIPLIAKLFLFIQIEGDAWCFFPSLELTCNPDQDRDDCGKVLGSDEQKVSVNLAVDYYKL